MPRNEGTNEYDNGIIAVHAWWENVSNVLVEKLDRSLGRELRGLGVEILFSFTWPMIRAPSRRRRRKPPQTP